MDQWDLNKLQTNATDLYHKALSINRMINLLPTMDREREFIDGRGKYDPYSDRFSTLFENYWSSLDTKTRFELLDAIQSVFEKRIELLSTELGLDNKE